MAKFQIVSAFKPTGDQPQAINMLAVGLRRGEKHQVLLGVTGSGKTFTMANVIKAVQKPTLVISHNKTLAGQLAQEFKSIFPKNAVEYFVSYYDYYQPEAYIPPSDTYIEKETTINEEIEKLRLSATTSLMTRKDVIVVASVSCIYNLGSPVEYGGAILELKNGVKAGFEAVLKVLQKMFYSRSGIDFKRSTYRVSGDTLDIFPSYADSAFRVEFLGDKIEKISSLNPLTGEVSLVNETVTIYPAKHYITPEQRLKPAIAQIESDLESRVQSLEKAGKLLEAQRLEQRTNYDLEMIKEYGVCNGIENYSRYFDGRKVGDPPYTLLDFFSKDYLLIIDESHITLPQIRGMYNGDRSRKETLIDFGFRLPSALDNRPLKFEEFQRRINQVIYVSATPDEYELSLAGYTSMGLHPRGEGYGLMPDDTSGVKQKDNIAEQLVRPTGIVDPEIFVKPTEGQIADVMGEVEKRVRAKERVLITTLTKRMAEDLSEYLAERGIKVNYLHSDIETLKRSDILQSLRLGEYDVLVGINLLREGLDLPEVSLVIILDADKEGFLRSKTSLIQTMGRAARHVKGQVIMYADTVTKSMQAAIDEVERRRGYQLEYNKKQGIIPKSIEKELRDRLIEKVEALEKRLSHELTIEDIPPKEREKMVKLLEQQMKEAAELLDFEEAARLRDQIKELGG
ncbi:excinuclease ABC subunit UvrB [Candidatus Daviesbacteria bacterium]|nr:excinuclease ABC subunit UvrB [Candidatus Daviesbacteria bacterium]